jgi:hypothetical protein
MRVVRFVTLAAALMTLVAVIPGRLAAQDKKPAVVPHDLEGKANCTMCHNGKMPNIKAVPAESHKDIANDACMLCHSKDSPIQTATPTAITHTLEGKANCLMCHTGKMPNVKAAPHEGIDVKNCTLCHKVKS